MTIEQAIKRVDEVQPNSVEREAKIDWLMQLDMELYTECVMQHEGWEEVEVPNYTEETENERELLVGAPFESIYLHWLQSRIDWEMQEYSHFNNANAAFEADRVKYRCWYNRTHMPLQVRRRLL